MSNETGASPNYMARFALVTIFSLAVVAFYLLGFQDSVKTVSGGVVLALPGLLVFGFMTWYNATHIGDFRYYGIRAAIVLDVLLIIFIAIMLKHVAQEVKLHQQATGMLLHLARSALV